MQTTPAAQRRRAMDKTDCARQSCRPSGLGARECRQTEPYNGHARDPHPAPRASLHTARATVARARWRAEGALSTAACKPGRTREQSDERARVPATDSRRTLAPASMTYSQGKRAHRFASTNEPVHPIASPELAPHSREVLGQAQRVGKPQRPYVVHLTHARPASPPPGPGYRSTLRIRTVVGVGSRGRNQRRIVEKGRARDGQ